MKRRFYLLMAGLTLVFALPLAAQNSRDMLKQAQVLFVKGDYKESLDLLKKVYKVLPRPILQWNMGRCMEAMKDYEGALKKYQQVLMIKTLSAKQMQRVKQGIARVKGLWVWDMLTKAKKPAAQGKIKENRLFQQKLVKQAVLRAKTGDLQGAMRLLGQAYELRHDPFCLWKKAGIYEQAGRKDKAIKWYKAYIKQHPGLSAVAAAKARIAGLQPRAVKPVIVNVLPVQGESGRTLKTGGYILAGTAIASIATGLVFTLLANRDYASLRNAGADNKGRITGMDQETAADMQATAGSERTVSWVMYGVGAAMAVTSVVMIVMGNKKARVQAFAVPTRRGVSLGFQARF